MWKGVRRCVAWLDALHRTTMEAVWHRALDIQDAASRRRGGPMSLTAIDMRFGGGLGLGDGG